MIRSVFSALLASTLLLIGGCGQGGTVDGKVAAARVRNDGPAIWVVKDHDSELFLFGTVHLLPSDLDWQKKDMTDAFDKSGTVFFEIDTGPAAQLQASILTQQLGFLESGQKLSDKLDGYQIKLLEAAANNGGLPRETLDTMRPWLASEFLTVAAATNAGLSPELSADEALKSRAARLRKNVIYLDTVEHQVRASADQPEFVQKIMLVDSLEGFNGAGRNLSRIAEAWSVGQTDFLTRTTAAALAATSTELYNALLKERNIEWASVFTRFMEGNETGFAAVGTAHLLGDHSVQNLLRDQGYTVSRYYAFQGENVIRSALE